MKKRVISMLCSILMVCLLIPSSLSGNISFTVKAASNVNLALNKSAFSSGNEVDWLTPDLAVDGKLGLASRWSSEVKNDVWFYVDLGKATEINKVIIRWQTPGVKYKIMLSNDAATWKNALPNDEILFTEQKWDEVSTVNFALQSTRYVKFQGIQAKPDLGYGFYEFEVYSDKVEGVKKVAKDINQIPTLSKSDTKITLPTVPSGYAVKLYGSDKKPIIDLDGNITPPLVDTQVNLLFEVSEDTTAQKAISNNVLVTVPGANTQTSDLNAKPFILPTLQEWHGGKGNVALSASSRIVVKASDKAVLEEIANITKADLADLTELNLPVVFGEPKAGDLYLTIDATLTSLGSEGYILNTDSFIALSSLDKTGVFYGTRTVLQILKQNLKTLQVPKGISRDYPKDEIRGVMLDVARKFYTIEYLQDYIKLLSWYKMNYFQIHLNDDVYSPFEPGWAFRLECETYPGLTSSAESGFYTKEEFRNLQFLGMDYGVNVVPEIDSPGHSGAYIAYDPTLGSNAHLDLENPNALTFMKALFDEYLDGPNPTFVSTDVHIGTDEYNTKDQADVERFRSFTNSLIEHINSKGKRPHFWGSLAQYAGTTPISTNATIDIWNIIYGGVQQSLDLGYDVVNFENQPLYIVPLVNDLLDYIDVEKHYESWQTEKFNDTIIPKGHPQMKGAVTALWNDWSASLGMSMDDSHDRLFPAIQFLAEKAWFGKNKDMDYDKFVEIGNSVGEAPRANLSHKVATVSEDKKVVEYQFEDGFKDSSANGNNASSKNAEKVKGKFGDGVKLKGGESYVETPVKSVGFGWTSSMWIKPDLDSPSEGILLDSPAGKLSLKAGKNKVKAKDFNDVFSGNIGFVDTEQGLKVTSKNEGQRISSTKKLMVDGLNVSLKNVTVPKPASANQNSILAFTLAEEHGHYHAAGAKGIHFRLMSNSSGKVFLYIQKADLDTDPSGSVYREMLPLEGLSGGMPENIDISFRKSGDKFVVTVNGVAVDIPYSAVSNLVPNGKAHVVFGGWTSGFGGKEISYIIDNIALVSANATDKPTGKLTYAKEQYETSFDYAVPLGEWTHILLTGNNKGTSLYINGDEYHERIEESGDMKIISTFVLPLQYIGSPTSAFKGVIDNVVVYDKAIDLLGNADNLALKKPTKASSVEVPAFGHQQAVDGSYNSRWSSEIDNDSWFSVDLGKSYDIDKVSITWETSFAKSYKIMVSSDEKEWTNVLENDGTFKGFVGRQNLTFKSVSARYVKFQGVESDKSYQGYSFFEFEVYGSDKNFESYNKAINRAATLLDKNQGDIALRKEITAFANQYPYDNTSVNIAKLNALLDSLGATIGEGNTDEEATPPQTRQLSSHFAIGTLLGGLCLVIALIKKGKKGLTQQKS